MQMSDVKLRLQRVEECATEALQACQAGGPIPPELRTCVSELDRRSHEAMQMMQSQNDEQTISQWVDDLERLGDRAMAACRRAQDTSEPLRSAIQHAHDELSSLKHQLH
ncbi:hypothetical protein [Caldimonas brevitalea]|uniref:Uncharacterized protein n=1 Tax=Caldimonas brevitalea TaxID=413882 RepID=A0A0G3BJF6_9BURK|nr:hypothetical protein [Caldimonas brevitalea]AKJ27506.1 hypothetical protein AAW51_0815 [Caldimonas brevitalea]